MKIILERVEQWSSQNGMKINKEKSAIVEFLPRYARRTHINSETVFGCPARDKYKYLRLWLNQKLTLDDQISHIKKRVNFIKSRLYPPLAKASLAYCKNLWEVSICPLFEPTLPIYETEPASTRREEAEKLVRYTFKAFTSLTITIPNRTIATLSEYDIQKRDAQTLQWNVGNG